MGHLIDLVEETLAEANSKSPLAEKIVAVLYGDKGSTGLRPGLMNKVFGAIGKIVPQEDFEKNQINMSTKYGDKVVRGMLTDKLPDDGVTIPSLSKKIREIVLTSYNKYVGKAVSSGKLDQKTKSHDDNYYGWIFFTHDYDEVKKIHAQARKDIEKQLGFLLSVPTGELVRNADYRAR